MGCCSAKFSAARLRQQLDLDDLMGLHDSEDEASRQVGWKWDAARAKGWAPYIGGCCGVLLVLLGLGGFCAWLVNHITEEAGRKFLQIDDEKVNRLCGSSTTMESLPAQSWWPGCEEVTQLSDFDHCAKPCFTPDLMRKMSEFNGKHPGKLVSYPSRPNEFLTPVTLTGWWLPAPQASRDKGEGPPPRVVLQHSFESNSNSFRQQIAAYMLRSLGFSVLLNNLRDHCYSEGSQNHVNGWAHSYPFDVLGAWDYAHKDPDGVLGGKLDTKQVGIMGFSLGAYVAEIAFGFEREVRAIWVDSPAFSPQDRFFSHGSHTLRSMGLGLLARPLLGFAWSRFQKHASEMGVYINQHPPEEVLAQGPDTLRPFAWVHNRWDEEIDYSNAEKLSALLEAYPAKYSITKFVTEGECNGEAHATDLLRLFEEYAARLCTFWTVALGAASSGCM